jgi:uncharacterized protein
VFILFIATLAGFVAQLVNGSLGMGYGTITMTFLLGLSIAPAVASACVNIATAVTGLASGIAHWKLGNIHWPTALTMGIPGAVGGFLGALALSSMSMDAATPVTATILILLGAFIVYRFARGAVVTGGGRTRNGFAGPTGLVAGFINAVGGGGWGPMSMSVMLSTSRLAPHLVVGSVSAAEFAAATAAVIGFWIALSGGVGMLWPFIIGLSVGGVLAAPVAAWLTRRIPTAKLGATIGLLVIALNLRKLLQPAELPWPALTAIYGGLVAAWVGVLVLTSRKRRADAAAAATVTEPEPVAAKL